MLEDIAYQSARYGKTLSVIFWWLELYGIQAKVEIVRFMSCIQGLLDWSIGRFGVNDSRVFWSMTEAFLEAKKAEIIYI